MTRRGSLLVYQTNLRGDVCFRVYTSHPTGWGWRALESHARTSSVSGISDGCINIDTFKKINDGWYWDDIP